jgi:enoyl-CoA hydratase/carnithine racemase
MSDERTIDVDVREHVATVTLTRPEVLNAFNQTMLDEFVVLWQRCRSDDDIRVVVLQADGDRAFSTGVDRKAGRDIHPNPFSADEPGQSLGAKQNRVWKPLICAVHGMVAGGAFYWLNEADVIICAEGTEFFDPHTTFGMASALEPIGLLRRMPLGEVLRIALFGLDERMSAQRAYQIGLVSEVVGPDVLRDRARTLALRLAAKPPLAVQGTVKAIWDSAHLSAYGGREIPLLYTTIANAVSKLEFVPGEGSDYELR